MVKGSMCGKGGMHGEGTCALKGGMCGERGHAWLKGGHVWQRGPVWYGGMHGRGMCVVEGMHGRRDSHCSGWYASYWNTFLFMKSIY